MSFRDFITDRWYRLSVSRWFARRDAIQPPANPSREHLDRLVTKLLHQFSAPGGRHELEMIGAPAAEALAAATRDPRFAVPDSRKALDDLPMCAVLELLVPHDRRTVREVAAEMTKSACKNIRKDGGMHLASTGDADAVPLLTKLLDDADHYMRSHVAIGVVRAVEGGRADPEYRRRMYDAMLLQCDQRWDSLNDAAAALIVIDRERAALDLGDSRWLSSENPCVHRLLDACNEAGLALPEAPLRVVFEDAVAAVERGQKYPHTQIAAESLIALVRSIGRAAQPMIDRLAASNQESICEAVGKAAAMLAGIANPWRTVLDRVQSEGYEQLSAAQRVVYHASWFDGEVCNGGIMQFFGNSSGDYAADTLDALREIGVPEAVAALEGAIKLVGPLARERDRDMRLAAFEVRFDELQQAFRPLESAYYGVSAKFRQAISLYAARHATDFRK